MNFIPPHEVRDQEKFKSMVSSIKSGNTLPAVVVYGLNAYTGSHRIAACIEADTEIESIEICRDDYVKTIASINGMDIEDVMSFDESDIDEVEEIIYGQGWDNVCDFNVFCESLYAITNDENIKNAIKDQF